MNLTDDGVPVDALIAVVKNSVRRAGVSATEPGRDLRVVSVHLNLRVIAAVTSGGRLEFRVPVLGMPVKFGRSVTRQNTHTIDVTLIPPDLLERELRDDDVESVLVDAIETIREVMTTAAGGDDPFAIKHSSVELVFAVTDTGSFTIGLDGEFKDEVTHTLRVELAPPAGAAP
jgi:hypothetical protein